MKDKTNPGTAAERPAGKKPYQTPRLTVHGRVDEITQSMLRIISRP